MRLPSRRLVLATAAGVLLAFSAAWVETTFVHEDDGCEVEIHCLACRWAAGTAAVLDAGPALAVCLGALEPVPTGAPACPGGDTLRRATSRGPPPA
jgi:hypothetical protein